MNLRNILCPTDFSPSGSMAMKYAASLAKSSNATLHLVHVFEQPMPYAEGFGGYIPPTDESLVQADLDAIAPPEGVNVRREMMIGHPADGLIEYANENDVDLIVMGTHGRTGLTRLLMGSVAEAVMRRAPCPVLTIKDRVETKQPT